MGRYAGEEYGDGSVSENSWRALKTQHRMMEDRAIKAEKQVKDALEIVEEWASYGSQVVTMPDELDRMRVALGGE